MVAGLVGHGAPRGATGVRFMDLKGLLEAAEVSELVKIEDLENAGLKGLEWRIEEEVVIAKKRPILQISFGESEGGNFYDEQVAIYDKITWFQDQPDGDVLLIESSGSEIVVAKCVGGGP